MIWLLACGGEAVELRRLPEGAGAEVCDDEPFEQLRIACLVESAARSGREGDDARARAACAEVPEGTWRDECRFRAGEELGRGGHAAEALAHCAEAGRFARFCLTHVGWGLPPGGVLAEWEAAAAIVPEDLRPEALDILRARWWFNLYYGTGRADPAAARGDAYARGAWALEAVRLAGIDRARVSWEGEVSEGAPTDRRVGRYDAPFKIEGEEALPRIRTFGGGMRIVGETEEEDVEIALLEALWFHGAEGAAMVGWLDDPRPRVRYTAVRIFRVLPSPDAEAVLTRLATDSDPIVAAHAKDGLKYRTWLGKGRR